MQNHVHSMFGVAQIECPDGFHEKDLTLCWSAFCWPITSSSAFPLQPIIPLFNTSPSLSFRSNSNSNHPFEHSRICCHVSVSYFDDLLSKYDVCPLILTKSFGRCFSLNFTLVSLLKLSLYLFIEIKPSEKLSLLKNRFNSVSHLSLIFTCFILFWVTGVISTPVHQSLDRPRNPSHSQSHPETI